MNTSLVFLWTALFSFAPISELRGGIPFAIVHGIPWYIAYPFCAFLNALAAPVCWIFLATLHKLFLTMAWYQKLFDRFVERARVKLHSGVEKWGCLGVALFVAIPFPLTGAWTGALGAWALGLGKRKTMLAVIAGVVVAGAAVTLVMMLGIQGLQFFLKRDPLPTPG
ncbi:MAG: small multi-drug export protein [Treponema sp.]|jgi:uncharacterized membrane protein|nr:small multi-drug export protein [Treponema sp.]